jgi:uncharacterized repeat protein (TIGR03803 family)
VFRLSTSGADYAVLHRFDWSEGAEPVAKLLEGSDDRLYGTTYTGSDDRGVVFRLNKDGTDYQVVKQLEWASVGHLVEGNDGTLFGTTINGGRNSRGLVFSVRKDGNDYRELHDLNGCYSDVQELRAPGLLLSSAGVLYGTVADGGNSRGIVFRLLQNGYGYEELHQFRSDYTEGGRPVAPLIRGTNGALYGTCYEGGAGNWEPGVSCNLAGTVFRLDVPPEHLPPLILTQPLSQRVQQGSNAQFRVVVSGTAPFSYQWRLHGTNLPQAQQATLSLTNVQPEAAGPYYVIISSDYGTVTSRVARLTVVNLQNSTNYTISLSPGFNLIANQLDLGNNRLDEIMPNVPEGCVVLKFDNWHQMFEIAFFSRGAWAEWEEGSLTLNPGEGAYLWAPQAFNLTFVGQRRQPILPLELVGGYNLVSRQTPDLAAYEDIVGLLPQDLTTLYRYQAQSGDYTMYYYLGDEWIPDPPLANVGEAVWIYGQGTPPVVLPPAISSQPTNQTVPCAGEAVFTVSAVGNQPLAYQWWHRGQPLTGATNSALSLSNVSHSVAGAYEAVIANSAGSVTSVLAYLTVEDTTAPTISCPTGLVLAAGANCQAVMPDIVPQAVATDACGGVTVTQNPAAGTWLGLGTNIVLMSATDDAGNTNTCTVVAVVLDITPPVVAASPSNTVDCGDAWPAPAAWDACCGNTVNVWLASSNLLHSVPPCRAVWTAVWSAMDCWGNVAIQTQTVTVVDTTPPVVVCGTNRTVICGTNWDFDLPQISDACCPSNTLTVVAVDTAVTNSDHCVTVFTRTWQVTDCCTNTASCSQSVTVVRQPPAPVVISCHLDTSGFHLTFATETCVKYIVESKNDLNAPAWTTLTEVDGDGLPHEVVDGPLQQMRFYRIRVVCQTERFHPPAWP